MNKHTVVRAHDTMSYVVLVLQSQELAGVLSQLLSFSHSAPQGLSSRLLSLSLPTLGPHHPAQEEPLSPLPYSSSVIT